MADTGNVGELNIKITTEANKAKKELTDLKNQTSNTANSMGSSFGLVATKAGLIAGALLAVKGAVDIAQQAVKNFIADARAFAKVTQAVKQTGGAAGFTAKELRKVAGELQTITGIFDEKILNDVTAQLLSFPKIAGDVFKRAQVAVLDLATLLDGDLKGAAIQVGKALQDPVKGINAMTRSGVAFTEQQKEQIKTLVESGDLLKAQTIILDEINNQYGGQAEALANVDGGLKKFNASWGDFLERIGAKLIPLIAGVTSVLSDLITPAKTASELFEEQSEKVKLLDSNIPSLLKRYDELKNKTTLTTEESNELNTIIKKISDFMPTAVSSYNSYGEALDITRQKVIDLVDEEKKLFNQRKQAVIDDLKEQKRLAQIQVGIKTKELNTGVSLKDIPGTATFGPPQKVKLQVEDYPKTQKELQDLNKEISELDSNIAILEERASAFDVSSLTSGTKITSGGGGSTDDKFVFTPKIPKGYEAEQVAVYERLGFEAKGYIEYAKALIEQKYENDIKEAKGNAEKIKQINEQKSIDDAKLLDAELQYKKAKIKEENSIRKERSEAIRKQEEEELKLYQEALQNKQDALQSYYNITNNLDSGFLELRKSQIQQEVDAFTKATNDKVKAKELENELLNQLEDEYYTRKWEKLQEDIVFVEAGLESLHSGWQTTLSLITDAQMTAKEKWKAIGDSMLQSFINMLGQILANYVSTIASQVLFGNAVKTAEVVTAGVTGAAIAAAYAPAAAMASIMSFGGAAVAGGAALASTVALAQGLAIPKFAKGADFIVQPGFPNDSFPMLVESGERVQVTPKNAVGKTSEANFSRIEGLLMALNKNLSNRYVSDINISGKELAKIVISNMNDYTRSGQDVSFF